MKLKFSQIFKTKNSTATEESFIETLDNNDTASGELIRPKLTFEAQSQISDEARFILKYKHRQEPPLLENQVSLSTYEHQLTEDGVAIGFFIRHTLNKEIRFDTTPLVLIDGEGKIIGRTEVPLQELGTLPACSSRPFMVTFTCDTEGLDLSKLKIAFEIPKEHELEIDSKWEGALSEDQIKQLEELLTKLPKLSDGEINFTIINGRLLENGLLVSLLIRNGNTQRINIETLPIEVLTMNQEILAKGTFSFEDLTVGGNCSKPWSLMFPNELLTHTPETLEKLSLRIAQ